FNYTPGVYNQTLTVTLTSATTGATIRYTTDGSQPSETAGTIYTSAIPVTRTTTINAIAYAAGMADSTIATGTYTLVVPAPTFSPLPGSFSSPQNVVLTVSSSAPGASIRYTTDGSQPSETAGTLFTAAIPVSSSTTIKAIGYLAGWSNSA